MQLVITGRAHYQHVANARQRLNPCPQYVITILSTSIIWLSTCFQHTSSLSTISSVLSTFYSNYSTCNSMASTCFQRPANNCQHDRQYSQCGKCDTHLKGTRQSSVKARQAPSRSVNVPRENRVGCSVIAVASFHCTVPRGPGGQ